MNNGTYFASIIPKHVTLGKYTSIGSDVKFLETGHHLVKFNKKCVFTTNWDQPTHPRPVTIGSDVWIGESVFILDGIAIGDGAIVGAGTLVSKDIPPYAIVVGNPQRIIRYRFSPEQIERLTVMKWWNWPKEEIEKAKQYMLDIDKFLEKYEQVYKDNSN